MIDWELVKLAVYVTLFVLAVWGMIRLSVATLDIKERQRYNRDSLKWYLKEIERLTWKISPDLARIKYFRSQVCMIDDVKKRDDLKDRGIGIAEPPDGVE